MIRPMLVQSAAAGFNALVSFGLMVFLARILGPDQFGSYIALLGGALIGLALIEGGWPTLLYRQTAADATNSKRHMSRALAHATAASLLLAIAAPVLAGFERAAAAVAAIACMASVAAMNLVSARLRGLGHFGRDAAWQAAGRVVSALAIVAALQVLPPAITPVFLAWAAALGLLLVAGRRWLAVPQWRGLAGAYRHAVPLALVEAGVVLLTKSETAILDSLGMTGVALSAYAACARLNEAALLLAAAAANVVVGRMASDGARVRRSLPRVLALACLAGLLCAASAALFGGRLMTLVFGPDFAGTGELLPYVAASLPFALPNLFLVQALIASKQEHALFAAMAVGATLAVAGLAAGMALGGSRGAALGAAAAQALLAAVLLRRLVRTRQGA